MNPLHIRIMIGHEDDRLLVHITALERINSRADGGCGLSPNEGFTLQACWERLDMITRP